MHFNKSSFRSKHLLSQHGKQVTPAFHSTGAGESLIVEMAGHVWQLELGHVSTTTLPGSRGERGGAGKVSRGEPAPKAAVDGSGNNDVCGVSGTPASPPPLTNLKSPLPKKSARRRLT